MAFVLNSEVTTLLEFLETQAAAYLLSLAYDERFNAARIKQLIDEESELLRSSDEFTDVTLALASHLSGYGGMQNCPLTRLSAPQGALFCAFRVPCANFTHDSART